MDISLVDSNYTPDPEIVAWIAKRLDAIAARFEPLHRARLKVTERRAVLTAQEWTSAIDVDAFAATVIAWGSGDDLERALDAMFVALAAKLRVARWSRDGVPARCRWCDGEEYLHVEQPVESATDDEGRRRPMQIHLVEDRDGPRGMLEALMCRGCGHVEWFAGDPGRISLKRAGVTVLRARVPAPYR